MIKSLNILSILLLFLSTNLLGQAYSAKIRKLSIEDGLSNRFVRCVFQDSKGFVWMGTNYGLNRYDGYSFKLFTKENQGLASNTIDQIYEDADSCLWVTYLSPEGKPLSQVGFISTQGLEYTSLKANFGKKAPFKAEEIFEIYQVSERSIVVVTKDKDVYKYNGKGVFEKLFTLPYPCHTLNRILGDQNTIWVAGQGFLLEYDRQGNLRSDEVVPFKSFLNMHCEGGLLKGHARYLKDSLMVFTKSPQEEIDYRVLPLFSEDIDVLGTDCRINSAPNGLIWYSDMRFSRMYNSKGELLYDFSKHLPDKSIHNVFSVYFDHYNSTWIATTDGVFILTVEPNKFHTYLNKDEFIPGSEAHSIRGMIEYDGFLYANTYSDRRKINLETGEVIELGNDLSWPELDIMKDKKGNLWFCGENYYVQQYNPKTDEYTNFECKILGTTSKEGTFKPMNIKLFQDSYDRIWLGTNDGVYYLDSLSKSFIKYHAHGLCEQLNQSRVYTFLEDKATNSLWAGTTSGVYKFDYNISRFSAQYSPNATRPFYIPHASILTMVKDQEKESVFWLGTNEGGLVKWEPDRGTFEHFTVATGLSDNVIYGIIEDENHFLWLSSNYGLMRFDKKTQWTNVYLPKDGITSNEFNTLSAYRSTTGRMYFGGVNGIIAFYPNHFQIEEKSSIPMHILKYDYLKGESEQLEDRTNQLRQTQEIVMEPGDNFFRLKFTLLDYRDPTRNRYAYKIDGFEQSWQYTSENELRINRLPSGNYTLVVKGQGFDGQWSSEEIEIPIEVQIPIYKTWYFWVIIALILGLMFFVAARWTILRNERNKQILEEKVADRTQTLLEREQDLLQAKEEAEKSSQAKAEFLSIMSHEIRTPMNAVVNLTNYLLEDNPTPKQKENLSILKFSANNLLAIINDVLDFNKIESGKIEFEKIDFDLLNLLESIHYGMAANAKKKNIEFVLEADLGLDKMLIGDPNRLTQILNNLISNAIKFTEKGTVRLKLTQLKETEKEMTLKFEIIDTGIGISKVEKDYIFNMFTQAASDTTRKYGGTGLGLAITKRLLQLQESDIDLDSVVGKGSVFSFNLTFEKGISLQKELVLGAPKTALTQELKGIKVLVVEDNAVNVLVVKKFLKKWGVEFTHAADGQEAVDKVCLDVFDIILMDIHMPNMDGYSAAKAIRSMKDPHYSKVPIIALTASALMDNRGRVYEAGMNDIVVKPFKPSDLYNTLIKHLS